MSAFEQWLNDQEHGCPTLVLDTEDDMMRAAWDAALEHAAKICEEVSFDWRGANSLSVKCAEAIRKEIK